MNTLSPLPRTLWPRVIIAWFGIFITFIVSFITWATRQHMDLVRPDYYEEEIKFQQHMDRLSRTRSLGPQVALAYDAATEAIVLHLPLVPSQGAPIGSIQLYRPADARLDQRLTLAADAQGIQRLDAKKLRPGLWKVRVLWTVDNHEYYFDQTVIVGAHPA